MAESRDRRVQADTTADVYIRRITSLSQTRTTANAATRPGTIEVYIDQPEEPTTTTTPRTALRRGNGPVRVTGRGSFGTARVIQGRSFRGSPAIGTDSENVFPGGSRGRSVLPSWYPRRPLQDVTSVVRAIGKRRARVGEVEGESSETPMPASTAHSEHETSTAHFEHEISVITPKPTSSRKPPFPCSMLKVPKILLDITSENKEGSDFLTPQKKLLNSIDTVEKVVMEELNKLKRTPIARKAEREKRVRTLMSMR